MTEPFSNSRSKTLDSWLEACFDCLLVYFCRNYLFRDSENYVKELKLQKLPNFSRNYANGSTENMKLGTRYEL